MTILNPEHSDKSERQKENISRRGPSSSSQRQIWSFDVVGLQRTAKKCIKNYNARAQSLFCSLNLLFCDVPLAIALVVS